jgi:nanoRNase/pAp phosphatase (c-di-AMP/oligoRNAs hydrolase)
MQQRLGRLLEAVRGASSTLILPHNDPDPDAIASAVALHHLLAEKLGMESQIAYKGMIGRAENKALVRYLNHPLLQLRGADLQEQRPIALVDTQPGAGNNALPPSRVATVVLDHHPLRDETTTADFADVRPELGSTATMLTEYLRAAEIEPSSRLATALFYGIKADTMGLVRRASPADVAAYIYLQPLVDIEALAEIERAQVSIEYFRRMDAALHAAHVYDNVILSYIGAMQRPDLAAEMADLLMRLKGVQWVICMGVHKSELILAVRTTYRRGGAGQLVQAIVGDEGTAGGHGNMAGGQIPLRGADPEQLAQVLGGRALHHLNAAATTGKPLMD